MLIASVLPLWRQCHRHHHRSDPSVPLIEDIRGLGYVQKIKLDCGRTRRYRIVLDILSTETIKYLWKKRYALFSLYPSRLRSLTVEFIGYVMLRVHKLLYDCARSHDRTVGSSWEKTRYDRGLEASAEPKGGKQKQETQIYPRNETEGKDKDGRQTQLQQGSFLLLRVVSISKLLAETQKQTGRSSDPSTRGSYDETTFFERVRRHLDNQTTHTQFLKLVLLL